MSWLEIFFRNVLGYGDNFLLKRFSAVKFWTSVDFHDEWVAMSSTFEGIFDGTVDIQNIIF